MKLSKPNQTERMPTLPAFEERNDDSEYGIFYQDEKGFVRLTISDANREVHSHYFI
jgi:hypothetical protein